MHFLINAAMSVSAQKFLTFLKELGHEAIDADVVDWLGKRTHYYVYFPKDIGKDKIAKLKADLKAKSYHLEKDLGDRKLPGGSYKNGHAFEISGPWGK